jgi:protein TonB
LSAVKLQKPKAHAAVPNKASEKQLEPRFNQKPRKNSAGMPTPAQVEHTAQLQKTPVAAPPKNIVKKARQKKSLKALTYKKQRIKTIEVTQVAPGTKRHIPLKAEIKISSTASSDNKPIHHVPDGSTDPTTATARLPDIQSDVILSRSAPKSARPLYKQNTSPPYPRKARRLGYEGIVMLKVLIDENGRVDHLTVLKSCGYDILDRAALSAVKKWLFEPGTEGGIKKKMWVKIPVRFDLE